MTTTTTTTTTTNAVLVLFLVLFGSSGALALPGPGSAPFRPRSGLGAGAAVPVRWAPGCSPRLALLRRLQDAVLQCELFAPAGTDLAWLKNGRQLLPQTSPAHPSQTIAPRKPRQCKREARQASRPTTMGTLLHMSTGIYIDCASPAHQGHYTLRARTPAGYTYTRNFSVILTSESVTPANTCYLGPEFVSQIPRVWLYVRRARGTTGGRLVLPCRVLDRGGVGMAVVWHFRGARLLSSHGGHKYEVLASGDLVLQCLEPEDAGLYTCTAYNTLKPFLFDRIHTWVFMPKGPLGVDHVPLGRTEANTMTDFQE